jgi:hypothetical protein
MKPRLIPVLVLLLACVPLAGCFPPFNMGCIREGELIETTAGERPVETLRVGDEVSTGAGVGRVERIAVHEASGFIEVCLHDGRVLRVTAEHPVATGAGFVPAGVLSVGQSVRVREGEAEVTSVRTRRDAARVFDLTVDPGETFFVSGVLVHNKTVPLPLVREDLVGDWIAVGPYEVSRLTLRTDGSGTLSSIRPGTTWRDDGRITGLKFNSERRLAIAHIEHADRGGSSASSLRLKGYRGAATLEASLEDQASGRKEPLRFTRESLFLEALTRLSNGAN